MAVELKTLLQQPEYAFIDKQQEQGRKPILIALGGSYAYGTNIETSDVDVRGCILPTKVELLQCNYGSPAFEQVIDNATDTVLYSLDKLLPLLLGCNPNVIEILGCKEEHYLYVSEEGKELLNIKSAFLSKKAAFTFSGYAESQLRRLTNALARDKYTLDEKEQHIFESCQGAIYDFNKKHEELGDDVRLFLGNSTRTGMDTEIYLDGFTTAIPLRDWQSLVNDLSNIIRQYEQIGKRNNKKDEPHLNKHAMHLIRLYLMGIDILEKGEIITYRADDLPLLMSIRNGDYMKDGMFTKEFYTLANDLAVRFKAASAATKLPEHPDYAKVNAFRERIVHSML